jgi:hypothetical protein
MEDENEEVELSHEEKLQELIKESSHLIYNPNVENSLTDVEFTDTPASI